MASVVAASAQGRNTPAAGGPAPNAAAGALIPFIRAARESSQQDFTIQPTALGTGPVNISPANLTSNGWLRRVELVITVSSTGNTSTVTMAEDGPFSAISSVSVTDAGGNSIMSPMSGFDLYLHNKYGVFRDPPASDPKLDPIYSVTTGSGATGGSFTYRAILDFEVSTWDAFCVLPNGAADKRYRVNITAASLNQIYGTAPNGSVTISVAGTAYYYDEPAATINGMPSQQTPNGYGSRAFFELETPPGVPGGGQKRLQLVNTGKVIRYQIWVLRNTSGARDEADWPDPVTLYVNNFPQNYLPQANWRSEMAQAYGFQQTLDSAGGLDTGVRVVFQYMNRSGHLQNSNPRDQLLPTVPATKLEFEGNWGGSAGSLTVLQHSVVPASGAALYA